MSITILTTMMGAFCAYFFILGSMDGLRIKSEQNCEAYNHFLDSLIDILDQGLISEEAYNEKATDKLKKDVAKRREELKNGVKK